MVCDFGVGGYPVGGGYCGLQDYITGWWSGNRRPRRPGQQADDRASTCALPWPSYSATTTTSTNTPAPAPRPARPARACNASTTTKRERERETEREHPTPPWSTSANRHSMPVPSRLVSSRLAMPCHAMPCAACLHSSLHSSLQHAAAHDATPCPALAAVVGGQVK
jgi:hypothetical protein